YLPAEQSLFKIDLNSVPTGIYFVHVKNNETTIQFSKLVIE
ncbi:MAG: T9SS type A sorting domain-containing protein, partial [Crocinitomicaceae bacterium]|nr:T9SS type A sorting domain-containing protein [Crocinitomicaceae bacterium]